MIPEPAGLAPRSLETPHVMRLSPLDANYSAILQRHREAMQQDQDGYIDPVSGLFVLTAKFHALRGSCCDSACRHCPYV